MGPPWLFGLGKRFPLYEISKYGHFGYMVNFSWSRRGPYIPNRWYSRKIRFEICLHNQNTVITDHVSLSEITLTCATCVSEGRSAT